MLERDRESLMNLKTQATKILADARQLIMKDKELARSRLKIQSTLKASEADNDSFR